MFPSSSSSKPSSWNTHNHTINSNPHIDNSTSHPSWRQLSPSELSITVTASKGKGKERELESPNGNGKGNGNGSGMPVPMHSLRDEENVILRQTLSIQGPEDSSFSSSTSSSIQSASSSSASASAAITALATILTQESGTEHDTCCEGQGPIYQPSISPTLSSHNPLAYPNHSTTITENPTSSSTSTSTSNLNTKPTTQTFDYGGLGVTASKDGRTLCVRHQMMADQGVNAKLQKVCMR